MLLIIKRIARSQSTETATTCLASKHVLTENSGELSTSIIVATSGIFIAIGE
jgi:hypothetical protein